MKQGSTIVTHRRLDDVFSSPGLYEDQAVLDLAHLRWYDDASTDCLTLDLTGLPFEDFGRLDLAPF